MKIPKFIKACLLIALVGFLLLGYCYMETRWIKQKKITIHSPNITSSFQATRIVFISDIHHGPYLSLERVTRLVNKINKLQIYYLLMGGDYVHRESKYIIPYFDELQNLNSDIETYAVLGNHNHWEDAELTRQMMIRNMIRICDNKSYWITSGIDSIKIGGVGDIWEDIQVLDSTTYDLDEDDFCILISHCPDYLEFINTDSIDLSLSGHTHGGQMTLFGLWAPILPSRYGQKYRYGLKQFGTMKSYISSGIGTITPPLRFFCRPEIVIIELSN